MKELSLKECKISEALAQIDSLEGLPPKNISCLRLLTEEMFSMCKELLKSDVLDFTISQQDNTYTLMSSAKTHVNYEAREQFLSMSSSGKNTANEGFKGLLGSVMEALTYGGDNPANNAALSYGLMAPGGDFASMWTLSHYMELVPEEKQKTAWDGMEKSIIANFADDVSIGVRSGKMQMLVTKIF